MNYHTATHGPNVVGFSTGLLKAVTTAAASGDNQVLLLTHALKSLEGVMTQAVGARGFKDFAKNKRATMGDVLIYLETPRIRSAFAKGVIFAPYVSSTLLEKALIDTRATDVVYVPWTEAELDAYLGRCPTSIPL